MKMLLVSLSILSLALVACQDDNSNAAPPLPDPACIPDTGVPAPEFLRYTEPDAERLAASLGLEVRIVGKDGECFATTDDLRTDRVNLEFRDDIVIGAAVY